jgi:hypothetical protein
MHPYIAFCMIKRFAGWSMPHPGKFFKKKIKLTLSADRTTPPPFKEERKPP